VGASKKCVAGSGPLTKPCSLACDRNRDPIFAIIQPLFSSCGCVLEIGSGTGQHAVYFAEKMPHLVWHSSDRADNLADINLWLDDAGLQNTPPPLVLDVGQPDWPVINVDAVFSANTAHIIGLNDVKNLVNGVGQLLSKGGLFILYGPFNYNGQFTSDSNREFDLWLKNRDPFSGIRDFEHMNALATEAGMSLQGDYQMPANNRILCWRKLRD